MEIIAHTARKGYFIIEKEATYILLLPFEFGIYL